MVRTRTPRPAAALAVVVIVGLVAAAPAAALVSDGGGSVGDATSGSDDGTNATSGDDRSLLGSENDTDWSTENGSASNESADDENSTEEDSETGTAGEPSGENASDDDSGNRTWAGEDDGERDGNATAESPRADGNVSALLSASVPAADRAVRRLRAEVGLDAKTDATGEDGAGSLAVDEGTVDVGGAAVGGDAVGDVTGGAADGDLGDGRLSLDGTAGLLAEDGGSGDSRAEDGTTGGAGPTASWSAAGATRDHAGPVPPGAPTGPSAGVAAGIGAVLAAAVGRHGGATAHGLPGIAAGLASTLTAGAAPIVSRGASALDRIVRLLAPLRYSRYDDSDPLEHDARAEVLAVVEESPGAYLSELADRADLPLSTARHHVRVLEHEDLVSGAKVRGKRRFFPAHAEGIELAAALDDCATAAILDALSRLGAASVSDLAAALDRDPSTVSHHLSRLAEDDLVVRERDGRAVMNRLAPAVRDALEPGRESALGSEAAATAD